MPPNTPAPRPATNAAPIVVDSATGDDLDRSTRGVGDRLHEGGVGAHPAVDAHRRDLDAGVGLGGLEQVGAAMGDALENGTNDVATVGTPRDAEQCAAGPVVPVRCAEAEQRWNVDDPVGVFAAARHVVALLARGDQAEVVAQPLDVRPGREHDRLDAPREFAVA